MPDFRELLAGVKQWMECVELTSEWLPETNGSRRRRSPTVTGEGYKIQKNPYLASA